MAQPPNKNSPLPTVDVRADPGTEKKEKEEKQSGSEGGGVLKTIGDAVGAVRVSQKRLERFNLSGGNFAGQKAVRKFLKFVEKFSVKIVSKRKDQIFCILNFFLHFLF